MVKMLVKFSKLRGAVFMSHLDLLRCVQRVMRRAGLPVNYSQGFNPHQVLSFAQALSLGVKSTGEYFETELVERVSPETFVQCFNQHAPEGVQALAAREAEKKERNAMAAVAAADYVLLPTAAGDVDWKAAIDELLAMQVYMYAKRTKSGSRQVDMRSRIIEADFGDGVITCRLSCGDDNLSAQVFFEALCDIAKANAECDIKRRDLLRRNRAGKLVSLIEKD